MKKKYTHLEALRLAAETPGREFRDAVGYKNRVSDNGCVQVFNYVTDGWSDIASGFAAEKGPFVDVHEPDEIELSEEYKKAFDASFPYSEFEKFEPYYKALFRELLRLMKLELNK